MRHWEITKSSEENCSGCEKMRRRGKPMKQLSLWTRYGKMEIASAYVFLCNDCLSKLKEFMKSLK